MKQSRTMSLVEAVTNVVVGYGIAVVTQILIFPVFGLHTTLVQNLKMGAIFSGVSVARSFALRRLFEAIRVVSIKNVEEDDKAVGDVHQEASNSCPSRASSSSAALRAASRRSL